MERSPLAGTAFFRLLSGREVVLASRRRHYIRLMMNFEGTDSPLALTAGSWYFLYKLLPGESTVRLSVTIFFQPTDSRMLELF